MINNIVGMEKLKDPMVNLDLLAQERMAVSEIFKAMADEHAQHPENIPIARFTQNAFLLFTKYNYNTGLTMRSMRGVVSADGVADILLGIQEKYGNTDLLTAMKNSLNEHTDVKRSRLHAVAEFSAGMKLLTLSSINRSIFGNTFSAGLTLVRAPIEVAYDGIIGKSSSMLNRATMGKYGNLKGGDMSFLELGIGTRLMARGLSQSINGMWDIMLERPGVESMFLMREQYNIKEIPGKFGHFIRTGLNAQGAIDYGFRRSFSLFYAGRLATRKAIREGLTTVDQILPRVEQIIRNEELSIGDVDVFKNLSEYVVFQNELGKTAQYFNKLRVGHGRMEAGAKILVPFFNTATNIFKYTYEHNPISLLPPVASLVTPRIGLKGTVIGQAFIDGYSASGSGSTPLAIGLGKITAGLGAMYMIHKLMGLEEEGRVIGDWSNISKEEREMLSQQGYQEHSFIFDNYAISFRGVEPLGSMIMTVDGAMRADVIGKAIKLAKDFNINGNTYKNAGELSEAVWSTTKALTQAFIENPFLMGVQETMKMLDKDGNDGIRFMVNIIAGSAFPGILRQMRNVVDPVRRDPLKKRDWEDPYTGYSKMDVIKSQVKHQLPWTKDSNLQALDPFGFPIGEQDPVGAIFALRVSKIKDDPVYQEIQKLYFDDRLISEKGRGFKPVSAFFSENEASRLRLTDEQRYMLHQYSGQWLYSTMQDLLKWEQWKKPEPQDIANQLFLEEIKERGGDVIANNGRQEIATPYRDGIEESGYQISVDMSSLSNEQMRTVRDNSMTNEQKRAEISRIRSTYREILRDVLFAKELSPIEEELGDEYEWKKYKDKEARAKKIETLRLKSGVYEKTPEAYYKRVQEYTEETIDDYSKKTYLSPQRQRLLEEAEALKGIPISQP
jgi:hypothetical protein